MDEHTRGDKADADPAGGLVVTLRGLHSSRLVTSIDEFDADVVGAHEKGIQVPTMQAKRDLHPELFEGLGKEVTALEFTTLGKGERRIELLAGVHCHTVCLYWTDTRLLVGCFDSII